MGTITLKNFRTNADVKINAGLKDGGVLIDWSQLTDIKAWLWSDAQKALAGRCDVRVDADDSTKLICEYAATKPQYPGVNRLIVQATGQGVTKTYDKPAFNFVRWTDDQEGTQITIDDPEVDVEIEVQDVSSTILDAIIAAAIAATADAEHAAHLIPNQVLLDCEQATQDANEAATAANAAGITSVLVSIENDEPGVPSADVALANKVLSIVLYHLKGEPGEQGPQGSPGVANAKYKQVDTLPTASADTMDFIYLTPSETPGIYNMSYTEEDSSDEESTYTWKDLGTTAIQLSDYATNTKVDDLALKVKDNKTEIEATDTLVENPVDFSRLALRNYSLNENGNYGTGNTYKHCLVPVSEGQVYRIVANSSNPTRYAWFTSNAASVSGAAAPLVTGTTRMNVEADSEKVVTVPATAKYLYIYRGASPYNYTPANVALLVEKAELSYVSPEQSNLIDPAKVIGGYIDNTGKAYESDDYYQTDYIPIEEETDYTVLCKTWNNTYYFRYVCFYNSSKARISGISSVGASFTSPEGAAYCIVSLYKKNSSNEVIDPKNYGLFAGASPSFVPYYGNTAEIAQVPLEKKGNEAVVTKRDLTGAISEAVENIDGVPPMTVRYTNPGLTISAPGYSNGCSLDRHYLPQFAYSANHIFNFDSLSFGDASSSTMNDDVAPSHFQNTTLGANHAQPTQIATIAGHGKTNADIGTAWVKGNTTFYIVRIVDEDNIEFLSENKGTYNNHNFVALTTGTLTKDEETMTVTAISGSQLWPSVANKSQKILLNGKTEVTAAGTYKCHFCDVVEAYEMVNAADVIDNLIARAGSDDDPVYTGASMLRFENIYRFFPGGQVLVMENVIALQQVPIQDIMFNQMALFGSKGYVKTYVPNSLPIGDYDFRAPLVVDWASTLPAFNFTSQYWKDPNSPPNRVLMIKSNSAASNGYGIALGFLPLGVGKDLKLYTNNVFELRNNTGKVYPHGVHSGVVGSTMEAGDAYNAVIYRVPFAPQPSYRIAYYTVPYEDCVYAFVDYSESKAEQLTIDEKWNGKPVQVVQAVNCSLLTDVYNHGFRVKANYISGETCFLVVKIG